jgi:hypothetical protein
VTHWADGGRSDIDNAALLCQRHHTVVHTRRLTAKISKEPDQLGRYVVWDLTEGSYDRHLELLQVEQSAHDPPPLTSERLRALFQVIASRDPDDQRWAEDELHLWEEAADGFEDDVPDDVWAERVGHVA